MQIRDKNFVNQLKYSLCYKVFAVLLSFFIVRLMLEYLGVELYGVWAIILSIMNWVVFFDFGISNGVKNKVSESLAMDDMISANQYVSTGYIVIALFSLFVYLIFLMVSGHINWQLVFNTSSINNRELTIIVKVIFFFILLNFIVSVAISVYNATQQAALIVKQQFFSQCFALIALLFLLKFTEKNLLFIAFSYGGSLVISNLLISILFFNKNRYLAPKISMFSSDKVKDLFKLGLKFLYLQLTIMLILTTDNIIITQLLGPSYVSAYDVLYKYFGALMIVHGLINTPLWSMYTEAYAKNDYHWISKTLKRMVGLMLGYVALGMTLFFLRGFVIPLWLGDTNLIIDDSSYLYVLLMTLVLIWHTIFAFFTNGINKTKNQAISTTIGVVINIPLSIFFVNYIEMGLDGVILATIISLSIFSFTGVIQAMIELKKMREKLVLS